MSEAATIWSGPSRALQFHMELFQTAQSMKKWVELVHGKPLVVTQMHPAFQQRALLQTSISGEMVSGARLEDAITGDGLSVGLVREKLDDAWTQENVNRTALAIHHEYRLLDEGQTFYVSLHMLEMINAIAKTMEPEPLFETDLPAKTGLIVFERPLMLPDLHPDTGEYTENILMPCRAIGWRQDTVVIKRKDDNPIEAPGIEFMMWVDKGSYEQYYMKTLQKLGIDDGPSVDEIPHQFWKTDHSGWSFGTAWRETQDFDILKNKIITEDGTVHTLIGQHRRWLLAFFRLYFQRITVGEVYSPTKHEKKRAVRMKRPLEDGYIKVVKLRRQVETHGRSGGDGNYYDHQFIVSGHWRRQWFRSLGPAKNPDGSFNHDSHRLVWIEPHIKGPITGPLVVGQQVQAVVR